jgi:hypothetical protein
MIEHFLEGLGASERVLCRLLKKVEKLFFVGSEIKHAGRPFTHGTRGLYLTATKSACQEMLRQYYGNVTKRQLDGGS